MDTLPQFTAKPGRSTDPCDEDTAATQGIDLADHPFPPAGPLPEFEGGLITAAELRVLLGHDDAG